MDEFAAMNIEKARFNMIEQQIKPWKVSDQRVLGAMATLPRERFVPSDHRTLAYADIQIPLGHNQTMLAPRELARMLQALNLNGSEKVLEIGCGSGYASALLGKLAKQVYAVDIIADFVNQAQQHLTSLTIDNVECIEADAALGWLVQAPYDAIIIDALLAELPDALKRSLSDTGKIVAILEINGQPTVTLCRLDAVDEWDYEPLFPVTAEPMINAEQPSRFVF